MFCISELASIAARPTAPGRSYHLCCFVSAACGSLRLRLRSMGPAGAGRSAPWGQQCPGQRRSKGCRGAFGGATESARLIPMGTLGWPWLRRALGGQVASLCLLGGSPGLSPPLAPNPGWPPPLSGALIPACAPAGCGYAVRLPFLRPEAP